MPYIHVRVGGSLSIEQRKIIAREFSDILERVAGKPKAACYTVFEEIDREKWAVGDELLSERVARQSQTSSQSQGAST
jgi:4-oxalocrotonate tautomerase